METVKTFHPSHAVREIHGYIHWTRTLRALCFHLKHRVLRLHWSNHRRPPSELACSRLARKNRHQKKKRKTKTSSRPMPHRESNMHQSPCADGSNGQHEHRVTPVAPVKHPPAPRAVHPADTVQEQSKLYATRLPAAADSAPQHACSLPRTETRRASARRWMQGRRPLTCTGGYSTLSPAGRTCYQRSTARIQQNRGEPLRLNDRTSIGRLD